MGYDGARQLTSAVRRDASNPVLESLTYGYDKAGNRIQVGTGSAAPRNYDVNSLNQLLSERDHGATTFSGFVDEPATVTVNGNPAKVRSTGGVAPFRFEAPVNRAVGANTVVVQARDGNDNVATKTYSVTTTGTSKSFEYDANGNLRYEKQPNGNVLREYRWDQQNRLVRMLSGTHESLYDYDGQSRRVRITEKENNVQTKQDTFIWCGSRICQKRSGSTIVRSYFANGFEENGTDDYFYTRDHLGTIREVVASNGMTVGSRLSYDPWGKLTETGSVLSDFTYTGHYYDRQAGLSLAWFRGYDPNIGRWLNQDPIGIDGGVNLYGYVGNDGINFVDPSGQFAGAAAAAAAGAALAGAAAGMLCLLNPDCRNEIGNFIKDACDPGAPPVPAPDCAQVGAECTDQCTHLLGENYLPGKRGGPGGGANTQFKFLKCRKICMVARGC
jgi:RHS repeat-associated protein